MKKKENKITTKNQILGIPVTLSLSRTLPSAFYSTDSLLLFFLFFFFFFSFSLPLSTWLSASLAPSSCLCSAEIFVTASHQTGLGTRSMTCRSITVRVLEPCWTMMHLTHPRKWPSRNRGGGLTASSLPLLNYGANELSPSPSCSLGSRPP